MKRNDVVLVGHFYGRIVRKVDDEHYQVICCGKCNRVYHVSEIEHTPDYKGFWISFPPDLAEWRYNCILKKFKGRKNFIVNAIAFPNSVIYDDDGLIDGYKPRFVKMPTLRELKQLAARYDKTVWKKYRKGK